MKASDKLRAKAADAITMRRRSEAEGDFWEAARHHIRYQALMEALAAVREYEAQKL